MSQHKTNYLHVTLTNQLHTLNKIHTNNNKIHTKCNLRNIELRTKQA